MSSRPMNVDMWRAIICACGINGVEVVAIFMYSAKTTATTSCHVWSCVLSAFWAQARYFVMTHNTVNHQGSSLTADGGWGRGRWEWGYPRATGSGRGNFWEAAREKPSIKEVLFAASNISVLSIMHNWPKYTFDFPLCYIWIICAQKVQQV